ncbi:porin family protein [Draconibacterium sp. IB214405]|uniref:porin family protein n=1 Tax=Draconibacterium sp. IB214405 TaxID=3097352 RepID=UPI002A1008CC|nr:porin family protein [Draconibacterium sp. IB214405]MDX8338117.1 porin family protein [Draconibacterium sp. IB214405]
MKRIFIATAFLFIVNFAFAQRFDAGIIAGFNGTQVEGDNLKGYHKAGLLAGMFVQTDIAPAIVAGMEIKYSQKGSRRPFDPKQPDTDKYVMKLGYIDIPLFMAFRTNDKSMIIGGIAPGVLIHSKEVNSDGEIPEPDRQDFNTFDLQPFVGFQFDFLEHASVDLRFALSVIPSSDKSETNYYFHNGLFNNVISLAFYYRLGR